MLSPLIDRPAASAPLHTLKVCFTKWGLLAVGVPAAAVLPARASLGLPLLGLSELLAVVILAAAAWEDLLFGRISNRLTYPAAILGLALACVHLLKGDAWADIQSFIGGPGLGNALIALIAVVVACGVLSVGGGLGLGDTKLLAATSVLLGLVPTLSILFLGSTVLALFWLVNRGLRGRPLRLIQRTCLSLSTPSGQSEAYEEHEFDTRTLPLAPGLFAGALLLLLLARSPFLTEMWP